MRAVKPLLEWALLRTDSAKKARTRTEGRALILAYHNIVPEGADEWADPALHLPLSSFREQLDLLGRTCEVVRLTDILAGRRSTNRPVVALTFDDAYQGAVTLGAAELVSRKLPATYFVAPGRLGGQSFWWDALRRDDGRPLGSKERSYVLEELKGRDEEARQWGGGRGKLMVREIPAIARSAAEDEIVDLSGWEDIELGSHSWSHPNLARLADEELEFELVAPLRWLEERTGRSVPVLAFPYGEYSPRVLEMAQSKGYRAAAAISGGWLEGAAPACLPRLNVPRGLSINGFALRLRGLLS